MAGYRFRYAGAAGCASTVKLLQNALGTANLCAAAEAFQVCEAAAIDTGLFIDVVRECGGIGLSTVFDRFADDMAARRDSGQGRLRIAAKDMKSAVELAHSSSAPSIWALKSSSSPRWSRLAALRARRATSDQNGSEKHDLHPVR